MYERRTKSTVRMLRSAGTGGFVAAVVFGLALGCSGSSESDPESSGDADVRDVSPDIAPDTAPDLTNDSGSEVGPETSGKCTVDSDCDDGIQCTKDSCKNDGTCVNVPKDDRCDDGDSKTPVDKCLPDKKGGCFHRCGTSPNCKSKRGKPGELEYCKKPCAEECRRKKARAAFLFTEYKILSCGGANKSNHNGGATIRETRVADHRFKPKDSNKKVQTGFTKEVPSADPFEPQHRLCGARTKSSGLRNIHNHGRTVAGDAKHRGVIGVQETQWSPPKGSKNYEKWKKRFEPWKTCHKISDAFCDTECGNCSYVLPKSLTNGQFVTFVHKDNKIGCNETHLRGAGPGPCKKGCSSDPKPNSNKMCHMKVPDDYSCSTNYDTSKSKYEYDIPDSSTHCPKAAQKNGSFCDASVSKSNAVVGLLEHNPLCNNWPRYYGLWGHNSNADFEAQVKAWKSCSWGVGVSKPGWFEENSSAHKSVCKECGTSKTEMNKLVQRPCESQTNTARGQTPVDGCEMGNKKQNEPECGYNCTAFDTDGTIDAKDKKCGWLGPSNPTCKWGNFTVKGL